MKSPIIHCQQLTHVYSGKAALSNVSFELDAGSPLVLVGPWRRLKHLAQYPVGFFAAYFRHRQAVRHPPGLHNSSAKSLPASGCKTGPQLTLIEQLVLYARLQGMTRQQASLEADRVGEGIVTRGCS